MTELSQREAAVLAKLVAGDAVEEKLIDTLGEPARTFARSVGAASPEDRCTALTAVLGGNPDADGIRQRLMAVDPEAPIEEETCTSGYAVYAADEACETETEPDWLVEGIVQRGGVICIAGAPGTCKTYLGLSLAMHMATGQRYWLGRALKGRKVLVVDEESGQKRTRLRIRELKHGHGLPYPAAQLVFTNLVGCNLLDKDNVQKLRETLERERPDLVVMDAFADLMLGGDENSVKDTQPVFSGLRQLADNYQAGFIVLHHANKSGGYRGSSAIPGAIDLLLMVEMKAEGTILELTTAKCRDTGHFKISVTPRFVTYPIRATSFHLANTLPAREEPKGAGERFVMKFLKEHGQSTVNVICEEPDTCSLAAAKRAIYRLCERQLIRAVHPERSAGGRGQSQVYELVPAKVQ